MFYGAAEFSRDTDLAILASSENFARLKKSLKIAKRSLRIPERENRLTVLVQ